MSKTFFIISSSDLSRPGAAQFRLLAIARGLCEHGAKVNWILIASKVPDSIANDEKYRRINFIQVGKQPTSIINNKLASYFYRLYLLVSLRPTLSQLCRDSDHKALFSVGDSFINLTLMKKLCRKERILLFHERTEYPYLNAKSLLKRLNLFLYLKIFIPQCDHIFVISKALRDFFSALAMVRKNNVPVSILNMLIETDRYQINEETEATPNKDIVYVGTMYGDKDGVYDLISAFGLIMNKIADARLVLIGDNLRRERMNKIYEALSNISHQDRIIFTGSLGRTELIQRINQAHCLALSRPNNIQAKYGFPTKLGEYLATGRPVVITGVGDIPIYLEDGYNAFVSVPGQAKTFAAKLAECLADEERATEIGERGRELVYHQFNYKTATKVVFDALKVRKGI